MSARDTGANVVSVKALRKSYGTVVAVRDVSFEVTEGEILGILGPNGSGKTTTIECLQGLRRADAGNVRVLGLDPNSQVHRLRRRTGSQLQSAALPDRLRVHEAVELIASVGRERVDVPALLAEWGLEHKRRAAFGNLSGGQRQRLFIVLALVNRPELVFLDEMTTGLDPAARRETWRLIERVRDLGTTVVLVTHFMDEAERLCDRLVVLRDGAVVATGTPADLVQRYGGWSTVTWRPRRDVADDELRALPGVHSVRRTGGEAGEQLQVQGTSTAVMHLGHYLVDHSAVPDGMTLRPPSLEDAFVALTEAGP